MSHIKIVVHQTSFSDGDQSSSSETSFDIYITNDRPELTDRGTSPLSQFVTVPSYHTIGDRTTSPLVLDRARESMNVPENPPSVRAMPSIGRIVGASRPASPVVDDGSVYFHHEDLPPRAAILEPLPESPMPVIERRASTKSANSGNSTTQNEKSDGYPEDKKSDGGECSEVDENGDTDISLPGEKENPFESKAEVVSYDLERERSPSIVLIPRSPRNERDPASRNDEWHTKGELPPQEEKPKNHTLWGHKPEKVDQKNEKKDKSRDKGKDKSKSRWNIFGKKDHEEKKKTAEERLAASSPPKSLETSPQGSRKGSTQFKFPPASPDGTAKESPTKSSPESSDDSTRASSAAKIPQDSPVVSAMGGSFPKSSRGSSSSSTKETSPPKSPQKGTNSSMKGDVPTKGSSKSLKKSESSSSLSSFSTVASSQAPTIQPLASSRNATSPIRKQTDKELADHVGARPIKLPFLAVDPYPNGLQCPSRALFTDGFPYPRGMEYYGITKQEWKDFTKPLSAHVNPHRTWWRTALLLALSPITGVILAFPFKIWAEQHDVARTLDHIFGLVEDLDAEVFRQRGLMIRLDGPCDIKGMMYMDLHHHGHIDRLARLRPTGVIEDFPNELRAAAKRAEEAEDQEHLMPPTLDAAVEMGMSADEYALHKHTKKELFKAKRSLRHVEHAKRKMAKRPRLVIESVSCKEDLQTYEKHGWGAWYRRIERHRGSVAADRELRGLPVQTMARSLH